MRPLVNPISMFLSNFRHILENVGIYVTVEFPGTIETFAVLGKLVALCLVT